MKGGLQGWRVWEKGSPGTEVKPSCAHPRKASPSLLPLHIWRAEGAISPTSTMI